MAPPGQAGGAFWGVQLTGPKNSFYPLALYPGVGHIHPMTYSIANPPETPGIYLLKNEKTGHCYVGQSRNLMRRYFEWKGVLSNNNATAGFKEVTAVGNTSTKDWVFDVLVETDNVALLNELEGKAIAAFKAKSGDLLLNARYVSDVHPGTSSSAKTLIEDDNGPVTYGVAAKKLGVTKQAVKKRCQIWRDKGVTHLKISGKNLAPIPT